MRDRKPIQQQLVGRRHVKQGEKAAKWTPEKIKSSDVMVQVHLHHNNRPQGGI